MQPYDVTFHAVPDERISELLSATNAAGFPTPDLTPVGGPPKSTRLGASDRSVATTDEAELPASWRMVRELSGQSYRWPEYREEYHNYIVYAGDTNREGTVHIALGRAVRKGYWGRDRQYVIAFLTSGSPQTPLTEFVATDDYDQKRELIAVIRGRDGAGSKKMYGMGDSLPDVYIQNFEMVVYRDHIRVTGSWSKMAVLAHEDDTDTMLNHALVQARRRGDL